MSASFQDVIETDQVAFDIDIRMIDGNLNVTGKSGLHLKS